MAAAADEEDVDIENVDETEGLSGAGIVMEDSSGTLDQGSLANQWLLYDDQQLFGQTWPAYGNDDMDDKSRATIERMLKEEQHYFKQKGPSAVKSKSQKAPISADVSSEMAHIVKGLWTEEEIAGFHEGMELFGRQWSKIADHIGTRTALQVKNYARAYFKKLASTDDTNLFCKTDVQKDGSENSSSISDKDVYTHLPENFETGSPTCRSPKQGRRSPKQGRRNVKAAAPRGRPRKNAQLYQADGVVAGTSKSSCKSPQPKKRMKKGLPKSPSKTKVKIQLQDDSNEFPDGNINIIEEKGEGSHVVIEEGEKVHLQEASGSDEDIEVDVEMDSDGDNAVTAELMIDPTEGSYSAGCTSKAESDPEIQKDECETEDECNTAQNHIFEDENVSKMGEVKEKAENLLSASIPVEHVSREAVVEASAQENTMLTKSDFCLPEESPELEFVKQESNQSLEQPDHLMEQPSSATVSCSDNKEVKVQNVSTDVSDVADQGTNTPLTGMDSGMSDEDSAGTDDSGPDDGGENTVNEWEVIPKAMAEVILDRNVISEEEKLANPSYFKIGTTSKKTPKKYLLIRNKILDCWEKCKPAYLTKTAVRPSLRGCGDVNRISAIHSALEHLGAINFGVENPFQSIVSARHHTRNHRVLSSPCPVTLRPRMTRTCNTAESKTDGSSTDENKPVVRVSDKPSRKRRAAYDPFKLIQCAEFSEDKTAPYHVVINSTALVVMDLHAHLSTTEIIGLLGGDYDESSGLLTISEAKPCRSLSTGMQCEMDPVSQTEASEAIMATGSRVVGWYHSHPTFAPNPSVRDIETQADFQAWFGPHVPFVGVIVSPYLRGFQARHAQSVFNFLTISQELVENTNTRKPYSFPFSVRTDLASSKSVLLQTARDLVTQYSTYQHRTEMLAWKWPHNPDKLYLEKVLTSIKSHLLSATKNNHDNEPNLNSDIDSHSEISEAIRSHIISSFTEKSSHQATISNTPSLDNCDQSEMKNILEESFV